MFSDYLSSKIVIPNQKDTSSRYIFSGSGALDLPRYFPITHHLLFSFEVIASNGFQCSPLVRACQYQQGNAGKISVK